VTYRNFINDRDSVKSVMDSSPKADKPTKLRSICRRLVNDSTSTCALVNSPTANFL